MQPLSASLFGVSRLLGALALGAGFGAATSLVNAIAHRSSDLESRVATTSGATAMEIVSVLLDSGWAWAGLAVATGWLVAGRNKPAALVLGALAGALALLAATAAYSVVDTLRGGGPLSSWYASESIVWWITSIVFGAPLGAVGACVNRPGVIGLLARLTVPVGAAVQMILFAPGRNEVIATIGKTVVWSAAAAAIAFVIVRWAAQRPTGWGGLLPGGTAGRRADRAPRR